MKDNYDVIIVGGSFAGSFFAKEVAEKGLSVLVLEKNERSAAEDYSRVFCFNKNDIESFSLPCPEPGDGIYCFEYADHFSYSSKGKHPKYAQKPIIGVHKGAFIQKLNDCAADAGAEFLYGADFSGFEFACERISGVRFNYNGEENVCGCKLAVDCTGKEAVLCRALPDFYGIDISESSENESLFIKRRYIKFKEKQPRRHKEDIYRYYGIRVSPADETADAIISVSSALGFEDADEAYEKFIAKVKFPEFEIISEESGESPRRRQPYTFVADGFLALGDAAALTDPFSGEGFSETLPLADIAAQTVSGIIGSGRYPSKELIWNINKDQIYTQGKKRARALGFLSVTANESEDADDYYFGKDIVFSEITLADRSEGLKFGLIELLKTFFLLIFGVVTRKTGFSEAKDIIKGFFILNKLEKHFDAYPSHPGFYEQWIKEADKLWKKAGIYKEKEE